MCNRLVPARSVTQINSSAATTTSSKESWKSIPGNTAVPIVGTGRQLPIEVMMKMNCRPKTRASAPIAAV